MGKKTIEKRKLANMFDKAVVPFIERRVIKMKIKIRKEKLEFSGNAEQIMERIEKYLEERELFLNHISLNGEVVYDNFVETLSMHNNQEKELEVFAFTYEEIVKYLKNEFLLRGSELQKEVEDLSCCFYALETKQENNADLTCLIEKIYVFCKYIDETVNGQYEQWGMNQEFFQSFTKILLSLQQALEEKDNVYIADLLFFELANKLENIFLMEKQ